MKNYLFILISVLFLSCTAEEENLQGNLNIPERFWCQDCVRYGSAGDVVVNITRDYITVMDQHGRTLINTSTCDGGTETDRVWIKHLICDNSTITLIRRSEMTIGFEYTKNNQNIYNFPVYKYE